MTDDEGTSDLRTNNRWSGNRKMELVVRLFLGEPLLKARCWRDEFL